MHIPDGFLAPAVWLPLDLLAPPAVAWAARRAQRGFDHGSAALLGVMGAFTFAAQMMNFPVGVGTSGHLVGGALLVFTIGAAPAIVVMTAILLLQALVFQDGGVLALGANVINMAIAGVLVAQLTSGAVPGRAGQFGGAALSVMVSGVLAVSELLVSGVRMPRPVLALTLALFLVSALIEGGITVVVLGAIERIQPGMLRGARAPGRRLLNGVLAVSIAIVCAGFLLASSQPDGIWSLAGKIGLDRRAQMTFRTGFADYRAAFIHQAWLSRALAGLGGLVLIYFACVVLSRILENRGVGASGRS